MPSKIQQIPLQTIDGADATLGDYQGDVLLVVNVASKCGLTPQYEALEAVYERFRDEGFAVLGFPANDFGGQEPGTNEEITEFCSTTYRRPVPPVLQDRGHRPGQAPAVRRADQRGARGRGRQGGLSRQPQGATG